MPRRGQVAKRDVLVDPLYNSKLVTRLVNSVMLDGKKGVAQKKDPDDPGNSDASSTNSRCYFIFPCVQGKRRKRNYRSAGE